MPGSSLTHGRRSVGRARSPDHLRNVDVPVIGTEVQLYRRGIADDFVNFRNIALLPTLREIAPHVPLLRNGMQLKTRVCRNMREDVAICDRRIDREWALLRPIKK